MGQCVGGRPSQHLQALLAMYRQPGIPGARECRRSCGDDVPGTLKSLQASVDHSRAASESGCSVVEHPVHRHPRHLSGLSDVGYRHPDPRIATTIDLVAGERSTGRPKRAPPALAEGHEAPADPDPPWASPTPFPAR